MNFDNKEFIDELLGKTNYNDDNSLANCNYDKAACDCNKTCDCSEKITDVDNEITIKLNLDTDEAFSELEKLNKKLNELSKDGKVIVFNNCVFQFGKHAMNTNYHKPVDNSCGCNCDCE